MKKWNFTTALFFIAILNPLSTFASEAKKVILVLGSGGSRALAHVGIIEELENLGVVPHAIVGCSAGAIVGALYAQDQDIGNVKELFINMKVDDLTDFSPFEKGAVSTRKKMEEFLKKHLIATDFSSLQIPFIAVATDLNKGEPVYFHKGELHPTLLASAAMPGLFPPYKMGGQLYVDGGVTDPLPVNFAHTLGDCIVIACDISPSLDDFGTDNLPEIVRKSMEVLYQRLIYLSREKANILLALQFNDIGSPIDDSANQRVYEEGKKIVRDNAKKIRKILCISE